MIKATLCLLRAGQITATSQGLSVESAEDSGAGDVFTNNTKFRAATFRPKKVLDFPEIVKAAEAYKNTFGDEVKSLSQGEVAKASRDKSISRQRDAALGSLRDECLHHIGKNKRVLIQ